MGIKSSRDKIVEKIEEVASTSTNLEQLAYAGASLSKLADMNVDGYCNVLDVVLLVNIVLG